MWIVFSRPGKGAGFASVVAKDAEGKPSGPEPEAIVSVRFRRREDAAKLFPKRRVVMTPGGDYAARVFVSRMEVAQVLAQLALEQTATNFKASIPKGDDALYDACHDAWAIFGRLQPGGPYGNAWRLPAVKPGSGALAASVPVSSGKVSSGKVSSAKRPPKRGRGVPLWCDCCGMDLPASNGGARMCADCQSWWEAAHV